uniref:Somatostatin/Cortistatin C-terminal domain-containing protein n=1 Tax=Neogobius melanostomus TaxID=47308 RepID=A0A8C6WSI3_9GOBI
MPGRDIYLRWGRDEDGSKKDGAVLYLVALLCFSSCAADDLEWKLNDGQLQREKQDDMRTLLEMLFKLSNMKNDLSRQEPEVVEREKKSSRVLWGGMRGCSFFFWKTWVSC